jgi:signal transduction histidine kinase
MLIVTALVVLVLGELIMGLLLWLEGQRTQRIDQRLFATIAFLLVFWTSSVGLLTGVDAAGAAQRELLFVIVNALAFCISCAVIMAVYIFSLFYPARRKIGWWQRTLIGSGILLTLLSSLPVFSGHFVATDGSLTYSYGKLASIVAIYAVAVIASIYVEEAVSVHHTRDLKLRLQTRTLLLGITLTMVHAVFFVVVLPTYLGQHSIFYALGYVAPYYLLAFTGYALLRQGLFDIRAIAARSLTYILSLSVASLLYVLPAVILSTYLLHAQLDVKTLTALVLMTLVVSALFQPLKNYFNKVTNRFFFRDFYAPQDVLDKLGDLLVGSVDIDQIVTRSQEILEFSLRPTWAKVVLARGKGGRAPVLQDLMHTDLNIIATEELDDGHNVALRSELRRQDIAVAVRIRTAHDDLGFILLGARRSGVAYSQGDRRFLGVFADELGIGLQNAIRFEEIERFNATLQEKVSDATRKLRNTNEKLKAMDETKDDFISMASHQLRTPLTSIKGYVSMVLDGDMGELNDRQRQALNQALISSQRMVFLIADLLNLSRLKTGKFVIEPSPVKLADVIEGEVNQLQETAKGRDLELSYAKPSHFPVLVLDETKIRQVVMNFLDNAIYYTKAGGHIVVSLKETDKSIEFTATDDGIGVPKAEQHHLFNKFYRAGNARKARPDGTGLGLFMAQKVIVAQGGSILFRSTEGKGSTFGFSFPKAKILAPAHIAPIAHETSALADAEKSLVS